MHISFSKLRKALPVIIICCLLAPARVWAQPAECNVKSGSTTACPGDTIEIPVNFYGWDQPNVAAISMALEIGDTSVLQYLGYAEVNPLFADDIGVAYSACCGDPPSLWFSWAGVTPFPSQDSGTLLKLRFHYKKSGTSALTFRTGVGEDIVDDSYSAYIVNWVGGNVSAGSSPIAVTVTTSGLPNCSGAEVQLNGSATNGTSWSNLSWTWTGPGSFSSSAQNPVISNVQTGAAGYYSLVVGNRCGTASGVKSDSVLVLASGAWVGLNSSAWNNASNWCLNGAVPSATTDVTIYALSGMYNPVISSDGASCKNIIISGGSLVLQGDYGISVYGNWTDNGSFSMGTGVVSFTGSGSQTIDGNSTFSNLRVNNSAGVTLSGNPTVTDTLVLKEGETDNASNLDMADNAYIVRYNGSLSEQPEYHNSISIEYKSAVTTGAEIPADKSLLNNMVINPGNGSVVALGSAVYVNGNLKFISGILKSGVAATLVINDDATISGSGPKSFVAGPVQKVGDDAFVFPTGDIAGSDTIWAPVGMSDPGTDNTDAFTATYFFNTSPSNWEPSDMCYGLDHTSGVEYWDVSRISGANYPDITLYWKNAVRSGITDLSDLRVAHYEDCRGSLAWSAMGGTAVDEGGGAGHITGTGFASLSPITFGASKSSSNPLPVTLLDFIVTCDDKEVSVTWSSATETNNDHFVLQRSVDSRNWNDIAFVKGAGNSNEITNYQWSDKNPLPEQTYYRLVQVDYDGHTSFFDAVASPCRSFSTGQSITISPNPFDQQAVVRFPDNLTSEVILTICDMTGRKMKSYKITKPEMESGFTLSTTGLAPGTYLLHAKSDNTDQRVVVVKM